MMTGYGSVVDGHFNICTLPEGGPDVRALVENGDFRKYQFVDTESWRVTDKFGTVYTFGAASTSRQHKSGQATSTFKWMLQEVRDLNDNYISYEYFKDNGQIYPSRITYTGSGSTDGIYEVGFSRTLNPDIATTTDTGFPVKTFYKISAIYVRVNGELSAQLRALLREWLQQHQSAPVFRHRVRKGRVRGHHHASGIHLRLQRRVYSRMEPSTRSLRHHR